MAFVCVEDIVAKNQLAKVNKQAKIGDVLFDEFVGYCRVIGKLEYKTYTHVLFINGYRKDSTRIEKEIEIITIGKPKKGLCHDKWLDTDFFYH